MHQTLANGRTDTNQMTAAEKYAYDLGRESVRVTLAGVTPARAHGINPDLIHTTEHETNRRQIDELNEELLEFVDLGTADTLQGLFDSYNPPGTVNHPPFPDTTHQPEYETANS